MRIAVPIVQGKLSLHFGHCEAFALVDVDAEKREIIGQETVEAPAHQPGLHPVWLAEQGANIIIAGGMGSRAQQLFAEQHIDVVVGAPVETPGAIVRAYLDETLTAGVNVCDH